MPDQTKKQLERHWAGVFQEALKSILSAQSVSLLDSDRHSDPPDALYCVIDSTRNVSKQWVELSGVYPAEEAAEIVFKEARGITNNKHSMPDELRSISGMDDFNVATVASNAISKKINKCSYQDSCNQYGRGHLAVFVPYQSYPLMSRQTATTILGSLPLEQLESQKWFRSVSLLYKNPDHEDAFTVIHLPNSNSGYAFVLLWKMSEPEGT